MVELFIPAAPKDYIKVPYVIKAAVEHVRELQAVHVATPDGMVLPPFIETVPVFTYKDQEVLDVGDVRFALRHNWIYADIMKLLQNVTSTDWYLVIDADLFFNKDVHLFEDGHPVFLLGRDQNHPPYFEFNRKMLGIGREYNHSFISECTLYSKEFVDEMLRDIIRFNNIQTDTSDRTAFIKLVARVSDIMCHPAESELYGNWMYHKYPGVYKFKQLESSLGGRYNSEIYTNKEIRAKIAEMKDKKDVDIFSLHSWEGSVN
jgi:hypothetical protein